MRKSTFLMTAALMACYITVNAQTEPKFKPSIDQLYLTVDGMLAAACYARLHACEAFVEDMAAARKEF